MTTLTRSHGGAVDRVDLERTAQAIRDSKTPNTRQVYRAALERFRDWLALDFGDFLELDADAQDGVVAAYLTHRADSGRAPATLGLDYAAIGAAVKAAGKPNPRGSVAAAALRGLKRQAAQAAADGRAGRPRPGVGPRPWPGA